MRDCFWRRCTRWPAPPERSYEQGGYATAGIFRRQAPLLDIPLSPHGTEFQLKVWKAIETIPYGQTRTYAEIAEMVGSPKGFRAVGLANQQKPTAHCGAVPPRYWSRWQARGLRGRSENQEIPTQSRGLGYLENEIGQATRRRAIRSKQGRKGRHARYSNPTRIAKRRYAHAPMSSNERQPRILPMRRSLQNKKRAPIGALFNCAHTLRGNSLCAATQARGVMGVGAVRRERGLHLLLNFELLAELRLQEALDNLLVFLRENGAGGISDNARPASPSWSPR